MLFMGQELQLKNKSSLSALQKWLCIEHVQLSLLTSLKIVQVKAWKWNILSWNNPKKINHGFHTVWRRIFELTSQGLTQTVLRDEARWKKKITRRSDKKNLYHFRFKWYLWGGPWFLQFRSQEGHVLCGRLFSQKFINQQFEWVTSFRVQKVRFPSDKLTEKLCWF